MGVPAVQQPAFLISQCKPGRLRASVGLLIAAVIGAVGVDPATARSNDLVLAFAAGRQLDSGLCVCFVLHNASSTVRRLREVYVEQGGQRMGSVLRLSNVAVGPGRYEYGMIAVERLDCDAQLLLLASGDDGEREERYTLTLEPSLERVLFSDDRSKVTLYGICPESTTPAVYLNGASMRVLDSTTLPLASGATFHAVLAEPSQRLRRGDRVFVECRWPSAGARLGLAQKVFTPFAIGNTQYGFPLHIVSVATVDRWLKMALYNESNSEKPALRIDHIRLNGRDITKDCRLPDAPLPADRQQYEVDSQDIWISSPWATSDECTLSLDYHLLAATNLKRLESDARRRLEVRVRKGLEFAIGVDGGPTLREAICLHPGGLRPDVDAVTLAARARSIARVAADIPSYVRISELMPVSEIAAIAPFADFVVAAPSQRMKVDGLDAGKEFLHYNSRLREQGVRFIASLVKDADCRFSADDMRWMCLCALFEGSEGILFDDVESDQESSSLSPHDVAAVAPLLATSCPVALRCVSNESGVHTSCVALGPDALTVRILNRWCSRSSRQINEPFYAVPRQGIETIIYVGNRWTARPKAIDLSTGKPLTCKLSEDGNLTIHWPCFRLGRVAIISRDNGPSGSDTDAPNVGHFLAERPTAPKIRPLDSPFLKLSPTEVGARARFALPLRNDFEHPVHIELADVSRSAPNSWTLASDGLRLPAHSEGVLHGELIAPTISCRAVVRVMIRAKGEPQSGFQAFLDARSYLATRPVPVEVHFGVCHGNQPVLWRQVHIVSEPDGGTIKNVRSVGGVPIEYRIIEEGHALEFVPLIESEGRYSGRLEITVVRADGVEGQALIVPFHAEHIATVSANPAQLTLPMSAATQQRTLRLVHATGAPITVQSFYCSDARVVVERRPSACAAAHCFQVSIPAEVERAHVRFHTAEANGTIHRVDVPVQLIRRGPPEAHLSAPESAFVAARDLAEAVKRRFQEFTLPPHTPSWLAFHRLLMFGEDARPPSLFATALADVTSRGADPVPPFTHARGRVVGSRSGGQFDHEHHRDQFLQYMALSGVSPNHSLTVAHKSARIRDILEDAKWQVRDRGELSWTAGALTRYLAPGETWRNKFDEQLSLGVLYRGVLANPDRTCGGSHHLCAIACALSRAEHMADPALAALWPQMERIIAQEVRLLHLFQHTDGSFRLPTSMDGDPRLQDGDTMPHIVGIHYTGHTLEWMAICMSPDELRQDWVVRAVSYLANAINNQFPKGEDLLPFNTAERCMNYGFVAHAVSALQRWHSKVCQE